MFVTSLYASIDSMILLERRGTKWLMRGRADIDLCNGIQPTVSTVPTQIISSPRYSEPIIGCRQAGMLSYGDAMEVANPGLYQLRLSMMS
jgi:hypothetical protein